jgi:hypothetical protein
MVIRGRGYSVVDIGGVDGYESTGAVIQCNEHGSTAPNIRFVSHSRVTFQLFNFVWK